MPRYRVEGLCPVGHHNNDLDLDNPSGCWSCNICGEGWSTTQVVAEDTVGFDLPPLDLVAIGWDEENQTTRYALRSAVAPVVVGWDHATGEPIVAVPDFHPALVGMIPLD